MSKSPGKGRGLQRSFWGFYSFPEVYKQILFRFWCSTSVLLFLHVFERYQISRLLVRRDLPACFIKIYIKIFFFMKNLYYNELFFNKKQLARKAFIT